MRGSTGGRATIFRTPRPGNTHRSRGDRANSGLQSGRDRGRCFFAVGVTDQTGPPEQGPKDMGEKNL
ncbi:MAG: hypothetical protein CO141_00635 [Candidatus Moranbacteria bacterium CG_4_9_14_3_um_filter_42_9]|nr:MAG: hypothetical protein CO141_00635 [Candidatus Moranbacteria bacterium CG_4_9_14_3_um_filter_42_9]